VATEKGNQIGIYRNGLWPLDSNGNGRFDYPDSAQPDTLIHFGGLPGDVPVVGDWNGDGQSKLGLVRDGSGWLLDLTGEHQLRPGHVNVSFGSKDYIPLAGPWAPLY
jgi:serine-aspartate repeat-containing protein C/D/E